jgi:hypothetical protein
LRIDRIRILTAMALAAIASACVDQSPIGPSANAIIVHAVLDASTTNQYIVVQTTTGAINSQKQVTGANVVITAPDGRALVAQEVRDSTVFIASSGPRVDKVYRISLDQYGGALVAGGTYHLHITLPDGREVTGATTIPRVAPYAGAAQPQTLDYLHDTLKLAWPFSPGVRVYEVNVTSQYRTFNETFNEFADTSVALPGNVHNENDRPIFFPGVTSHVVVSAVDDNYYDYFRRGSDIFTGSGLITHLNGAVGVFGSVVPIVARTISVR